MRFPSGKAVVGVALVLALSATDAWGHWCDDMWSSSYNIVVRPDSDTSPKALYVQNSMGYQLPNFKLKATSASGGAITLTAPTTLKVGSTLLPGERGTWKIASGNPAKIEDISFSVSFGSGVQSQCYPLAGGNAVMVVKADGSLYPAAPAGLDSPKAPDNGCVGIISCGCSLVGEAIADFEDVNVGLDKLLQLYCSGRASWGAGDAVSKTYCKDTSSTTCPTTKPVSVGAITDYPHLWAAGELAIRKGSLGARLPVFRERLKCGANDGDMGMAGYALFILGYLGDDAGARTFLQTKASAAGDLGTIAKAALYLMGDTAQKADVQAGMQSSSVFVKVACAAALGIVDKDDTPVTSAVIPEVKWNNPSETTEDGKGIYAAHILEIAAFDRRGWVFKGVGSGPVTFYGETGSGIGGTSGSAGASGTARPSTTGGAVGSGGASGPLGSGGISGSGGVARNRDAGDDAAAAAGGAVGSGGRFGSGGSTPAVAGSPGSGGTRGEGGVSQSSGQGGHTTEPQGAGGSAGSGGGGANAAGGSPGVGGSTAGGAGEGSDCRCSLGARPHMPTLWFLAVAWLAFFVACRRRG
jgi:hypothetical protein